MDFIVNKEKNEIDNKRNDIIELDVVDLVVEIGGMVYCFGYGLI